MNACVWWDNEHECCTHPESPYGGDCVSWLDICPYEEIEDEEEKSIKNNSLIDFLVMVVTNSHKCQHCIHCFHGSTACGCINAYHCIGNDYADYDEGDE